MAIMYFSLVLSFGIVLLVQGVVLIEKIGALCKKEEGEV